MSSMKKAFQNINITEDGISTELVVIGKKTNSISSSVEEIVYVKQISWPVPSADESGKPLVSTFVIESKSIYYGTMDLSLLCLRSLVMFYLLRLLF